MVDIFKPQLALSRERDGAYLLRAVTLTPSNCYGRGRAERRVPEGVDVAAHLEPITLHLTYRHGTATDLVTPVRHLVGDIALGPRTHKTGLIVFVVLEQRVLGTTIVAQSAATGPRGPIETRNWYAWVERNEVEASLEVIGLIDAPCPGFSAALVPIGNVDITRQRLHLGLSVIAPSRLSPPIVTSLPVRYSEGGYRGCYREILIRDPDGEDAVIAVDRSS